MKDVANGLAGSRPSFHRMIAAHLRTAPFVAWLYSAVPPLMVPLLVTPLLSLILGVVFAACAGTPGHGGRQPAEWEHLIRTHLVRYPLMEPPDLYKLLHQAALGSEHAVQDTSAALEWLDSELATMGPGPVEPLVDSLRADGWMVRIHLRPFVAAGGDPGALLQAFIGTGAEQGDREDLRRAGEVAVRLAREKALPWPDSTVSALFAGLAAQGYPAVHHSAAFVEHYRPAYRVVAGGLLRGVLPAVDTRPRRGAPK